MTAVVRSAVTDARPPLLVVRLTNLFMRPLLRTPIGHAVKPLALLEFTGRRSGVRRRVVVGWHHDGTTAIVQTPAPWRKNFDHGHPATVYWRGQRSTVIGTLDTDPTAVAAVLTTLLQTGKSARSLALHIPAGQTLDHHDIDRTNRAIIHFEPVHKTNIRDASLPRSLDGAGSSNGRYVRVVDGEQPSFCESVMCGVLRNLGRNQHGLSGRHWAAWRARPA